MAIKVKVFMWNGLVESVLSDTDEEIEVEFIDTYTPKYGGVGSDEDAAEKYQQECRTNGFKDVSSFETGVYKNPPENDDESEEI